MTPSATRVAHTIKSLVATKTYDRVPFIILLNESELVKINNVITSEAYGSIIKPFNANIIHDKMKSALTQ